MNENNTTRAAEARQDLVPGVMRCAKCDFKLNRINLNVNVGTVTAGDSKTEPCPNGCGPLWPVTWEQEAREGYTISEQLFERADAAEKALVAIYDAFSIGSAARSIHILMANLANALRREQCLSALERTFFMVPTEPEEEDDGVPGEECLLNWGQDPAEYVRTFREALKTINSVEAESVYLVATGETREGQETYTRHDVRPPLCEAETLYTRAALRPQSAPTEAAAQPPMFFASPEQANALQDRPDDSEGGGYLPLRKKAAGKFTMPLYRAPVAAVAQLPVGWKLVPVEPTPVMLHALWKDREHFRGQSENKTARHHYALMLAASPSCGQPAMCATCSGHGLVGSLLSGGGGYDAEDCPDCTPPAIDLRAQAVSEGEEGQAS